MQELINRIIQINQIADQKVKQAESEQQKAFNHLETEKVDVSDEIQSRATNRLGNFEDSEKRNAVESIKKIRHRYHMEKQRLQEIYDQNHKKWVDQLVNQVLHK